MSGSPRSGGADLERTLLPLIEAARAEHADEEAIAELQQRLRSSAEAREFYLDYTAMHADLCCLVRVSRVRESVGAGFPVAAVDAPHASRRGAGWSSVARYATVLAVAAAVLLMFQLWPGGSVEPSAGDGQPAEFANPRRPPIATLRGAFGAEARVQNQSGRLRAIDSGDVIYRGESVAFREGLMEFEFHNGAVVVLEGPAEFVFASADSGRLSGGRLAAVVPPWADGFYIDTPTIQVTDRGTEFAVSVDASRNVDVTVTKGEVEIAPPAERDDAPPEADGRRVLAGDSVRASADGLREVAEPESLVRLTTHLPDRPDGTQMEVVGRYQADFVSGVPGQPRREGLWRHYANETGPIGQPRHYRELLWDPRGGVRGLGCYDIDGELINTGPAPLRIVKLRQGTGHPGAGSQQSPDGIDHYAIAAFTVPRDGVYHLESGWIFRPEHKKHLTNQSVDVVAHVDDRPPAIEAVCEEAAFLQFRGGLGELQAGSVVYVGVGPRGVNHNDRFEWGFFIVRELSSPAGDAI